MSELIPIAPHLFFMFGGEVETLQRLSLEAPPGIAVEIGAGAGASTAAIASARRKVFSVDISFLEPARGYAMLDEWKKSTKPVAKFVEAVAGNSVEVAKDWTAPISFLFIDGGHKFTAVQLDIEAWLPLLIVDGIVAFHDYGHHEGVTEAVNAWEGACKESFDVVLLEGTIKAYRKLSRQ